MMDVVPRPTQRHGEMHHNVVLAHKTVADMKVEVLRLPADAGVDDDIAADQCGDAESAPDARRPPTPLTALHPGGCGAERERVDYPRRRATGVADDAVARLQPLEHLPHRCRIDLDQFLQPGNIGGETIIDEPAHQVMMDRRFKFTLLDHFRLQFPRKKWKCRSNLSTPLRPCVDAKGHPQTRLPKNESWSSLMHRRFPKDRNASSRTLYSAR